MAGLLCPKLLDKKVFNKDVEDRIRFYLKNIPGNVGAYSESVGYKFARTSAT